MRAAELQSSLNIGETLDDGRFQIQQAISVKSRGDETAPTERILTSEVLLASDWQGQNEAVVIKILHENDAQSAAQARREVITHQSVTGHPHIMPLLAIGKIDIDGDERTWFAMPHAKFGSVDKLRASDPYPVGTAIEVGREIAPALQSAHDKGIAHLDVKPGNIVVTDDERPFKLIDFGIAEAIVRRDTDPAKLRNLGSLALWEDLKSSDTVRGTTFYMPAESHTDRAYMGPEADVFGLGVTMFRIATNRFPFPTIDDQTYVEAVLNHEPASARQYNSDVSLAFDALIKKCLATDLFERPSMAEVSEELRYI